MEKDIGGWGRRGEEGCPRSDEVEDHVQPSQPSIGEG
jgi:hypothetical protein